MNHFWCDCKMGLFWVFGGPLDGDTVDFIFNTLVPGKIKKDKKLEHRLVQIGEVGIQ